MKDEFSKAADRAQERGERSLARRIRIEGRIARAIVDAALARGWSVSVFDCEEWTVKKSKVRKTIIQALFTTDDDTLCFFDAKGAKVGSMWLIYGNCGYDVVSDYSCSLEDFYNEVVDPLAEKLEAQCV